MAQAKRKQTLKDLAPAKQLSNVTPQYLADELGDIKAQMKILKARETKTVAALKKVMKAEYSAKVVGENYIADLSHGDRTTLDIEAIRQEMGLEWIANHSKTSNVATLRISKVVTE